ncbi:thiamine pyrophosphate-binding protein [Methanomicrobiaceae archaeon CYW5]|uniref:sulfopyruvate decarboxylase subunit beta n=1 Tax=Methanovulcanius yangii TaxID=1789227 RepID=UPI0029CA199A|nr:sulfopyruvate decarboxylase subunit beta [Methanovulcanius yangii]MBT8508468.1 thiamine pyrophosphate-binding protein [Methanovulcanius yangii]
MHEEALIAAVRRAGAEVMATLPCDRTKDLCTLIPRHFREISLLREEDGVGLCAGLALAGRRPVMHIQSSGLGNMLNAILTLPSLYRLPLPVLASWRGVWREKIEAQVPFNSRLPAILAAAGIACTEIHTPDDIALAGEVVADAYEAGRPHVALISPAVWEGGPCETEAAAFPRREREIVCKLHRIIRPPGMRRYDAIAAVAPHLGDALAVANLGVPSKELYAIRDRPENFYMLGSYTQATPIGFGCALGQDRDVVVFDGDGSLLGTAILPVIAAEAPANLTIIALDNGAFGSTGSQMTHAWRGADLELIARGAGFTSTTKVQTADELVAAYTAEEKGPRFIHVVIAPGNADVPNIPLSALEIRERFCGN